MAVEKSEIEGSQESETQEETEERALRGDEGAGNVPAPVPHPIEERLEQLAELREQALHAGSEAAVARQHERGKLTARERLEKLLDEGSFVELDMLARHRAHGFGIEQTRPLTDGVVTGWGTIDGRKVFVFAQDFTVFGGALGEVFAEKIHKVMDLAESVGAPMIGLNDGAGARIQEGVVSLDAYGGIFFRNVKASGVIPQVSVILGPCAGGAVYSPAITDFVFMVKGSSHMFITGPDVVKTVTGEDVSQEELGGAMTHASKSGVATFVADDEDTALDQVRYLLSFLPSNNLEEPPYFEPTDDSERRCEDIVALIPDSPNQPYDIKAVINQIVDDGDFFEVHALWAQNIVCGFARIDGHAVGIVGNQPQVLAGTLDIDASEKGARFVRLCDAFNVPLVTFVDVPGFLPGTDQEYGGIIRHGAKLLYAYCEATVPRVQIITRKAYGGAYVVMNSKSIGADLAFAWPSAEVAVMGPQGAVNIIFRKEIETAADPDARRAELIEEYTERFANPYIAAERGYVDDVIDPRDTRRVLARSLAMLRTKREQLPQRKHGNLPL
ncbi:MAG: acyl-CoA carboxylase subunit beta [Actinobacteria bacterium]|nr:acyl-CoA carboxylase subunit beta [Actinomycetota bacterium]